MENESGFYEIENLEIVVESETDKAVKGLDKLHEMLEKLDNKVKNTGLGEFCNHLKTIASTDLSKTASDMERMVSAQEKLAALEAKAMEATRTPATALPQTAGKVSRAKTTSWLTGEITDVNRMGTALDKLVDPQRLQRLETFHSRMQTISALELGKVATDMERMAQACKGIDLEKIRRASGKKKDAPAEDGTTIPQPNKFTELWQKAKATGKLLQEYTSLEDQFRNLRTAWKGANNEWSKTHDVMEKTQKKANSMNLMKAVKTILLYNVLFSALNAVTGGIKEGIDNVTRASKEANKVMTDYKTTTLQLKNALGAAVIPVLERLYPLFELLADGIMEVANAVNILFSLWNGDKTYIRAKKQVEDYASALKKTRGLLGMDEINTMGKSLNYNAMYETVEIDGASVGKAIGSLTTLLGLITGIGAAKKAFTAFFTGTGAISKWGGVVGLAAVGLGLLVSGIADINQNGRSLKNTLSVCFGTLIAGGAAALALGGWIPLAIAAIVAALAPLIIWGDKIVAWLSNAQIKWKGLMDAGSTAVADFFDMLSGKVSKYFPELGLVIRTIKDVVLLLMGEIGTLSDYVLVEVGNLVGLFSSLFRGDFAGALEYGKAIYVDFLKVLVNLLVPVGNFFISTFESIINFFIHNINKLLDIYNGIVGTFGGEKIQIELIQDVSLERIKALDIGLNTGDTDAVGDSAQNATHLAKNLSKITAVNAYATGGFPEDGLFLANHSELIGRFSNGRTAVANNEQIIEGISRGVATATDEQNSLLREQNRLLAQIAGKEAVAAVSVSTITRGIDRQNRRAGRAVSATS